jgi:hypothetical protein
MPWFILNISTLTVEKISSETKVGLK